jgi:hypothetical protein
MDFDWIWFDTIWFDSIRFDLVRFHCNCIDFDQQSTLALLHVLVSVLAQLLSFVLPIPHYPMSELFVAAPNERTNE